jgi:hypothetical protein
MTGEFLSNLLTQIYTSRRRSVNIIMETYSCACPYTFFAEYHYLYFGNHGIDMKPFDTRELCLLNSRFHALSFSLKGGKNNMFQFLWLTNATFKIR